MISLKKYIVAVLLLTNVVSCQKDTGPTAPVADRNTLNYVVRDNFGLSFLAVALNRTGLETQLAEPGPYTLLAPSDAAFQSAGFNTQAAVSSAASELAVRCQYHVLPGDLLIEDQPLAFNMELETILGTAVYLSRVELGEDTVTTVNGGRVLRADTHASNGVMHVLDRFLHPAIFDKLGDALSSDAELALFYHAVKHAGLLPALNSTEEFTVFALNNTAMSNLGYHSMMDIAERNPEELRAFLEAYISRGRKFAQDYYLMVPPETGSTMSVYTDTMLDGVSQEIRVRRTNGLFLDIQMRRGTTNTYFALTDADVVAGNGVLHVINQVLR
ncbi:fasciclin domain-containing protein [Sphingobacterium haloxyli]|uniref:FAS1 domain-containing protein n=1 Tax=Sphingobacterium haloxyli TaxID=2100533 RepID=A0A2S9J4Y5_9SPHI|nr:fasciclin domain-containing protein [Sphingobacterium haloxyli]PRD47822.1 hypothetical protein C5745_07860 [Sphingobacterium haloxyli]